MATCFIIQPFDDGPYDKRFDDILKPAVEGANLEPYRVDRDPSVNVPMEHIESGIRSADACLADITTDNPNVWFELGFAIASQKDVVLICSAERKSRFPFDGQHRSIIRYSTESTRDFDELRKKITERLQAILSKESRISEAVKLSPVADVEGLSQHEMVALVSVAQNLEQPQDAVSASDVRRDMERAGFTRIAFTLGVTVLRRKGLVSTTERQNYDGDPFTAYQMTEEGMDWLQRNQHLLVLRQSPQQAEAPAEDTIPF